MLKTPDILKKIVDHKIVEVATRSRQQTVAKLSQIISSIAKPRGFAAAIESVIGCGKPAVIAEIKKASPSKGVLRQDFRPAMIAKQYEQSGACCLSVLTDELFFQGHSDYLHQAKDVVQLPILRKDFIIDPYQVYETRAMGADCILLIVAILDDAKLLTLSQLATQLGLDILVEVHNNEELERAKAISTRLIGINNRDLHSFQTSVETTIKLLSQIPKGSIVVTESGIHKNSDVARLRDQGVNAFLVGEAFMKALDPGVKLRELFGE